MTKEEKYTYWLELSQYDLDTAAASAYYLMNRYPDFSKQANRQISRNEAELLLTKTKEVFSWLLTLKPSTKLPENTL